MEIIQDNAKEYTHTCQYCTSIFKYKRVDLTFAGWFPANNGWSVSCDQVKCPCCGTMIVLYPEFKNLPSYMK